MAVGLTLALIRRAETARPAPRQVTPARSAAGPARVPRALLTQPAAAQILRPQQVSALQHTAGNQRIARLLAAGSQARPAVRGASHAPAAERGPFAPAIQRMTDRATKKDVPIDWDKLNAASALKLLQKVASGQYSAPPAEMSRLMDIANPQRHEPAGDPGMELTGGKAAGFSSRMAAFEHDPEHATKHVVPAHEQLKLVKMKQAQVKAETNVSLTEDQAWSLVLAESRGAYQEDENREKVWERLQQLNADHGTTYTKADIDLIGAHLRQGTLLATNYTFSSSPGANIGARVATGDETLASLLMKNRTFRQVWETGASQASTNLARRGAVEESMGYGHALTRTRGAPLSQTGFEGPSGTVFAPERPEDLPKYAALVSKHQRYGVAPRYGPSVVYWKRDLRNRITHTPGDSWNLESQGSLMSFASASHPEAVLRHMDPLLLRLAAAEATGKDAEFLKGVKAKGGVSTDAYVETQIHGELSWEDVDHIVIGAQETNAEGLVAEFRRFARAKGYTFTVTLRED